MPSRAPKATRFPQWKGFERSPLGVLLDIVVDQTGDMGIAYERSCDFLKERHAHDRWQITFARTGCRLDVRTFRPDRKYRLTSRNFLVLPPGLAHEAEGVSSIYDTFTLYPSAESWVSKPFRKAIGDGALLDRTPWIDQLVERYFLKRILDRAPRGRERSFLENEVRDEVESIARGLTPRSSARPAETDESPLHRALTLIEGSLFQSFDLATLARRAGASASTLLRAFRAELGTTPYAYVRRRRLEEAQTLLVETDRSIGEIAVLVGFNHQGAFSEAFLDVYGVTPSLARKNAR